MLRPGTSPGSYIAVDLMADPTPPLPPSTTTAPTTTGVVRGGGVPTGASSNYVDDGFGPASVAFLCTDASPAKKSPALNSSRGIQQQQQQSQMQQQQQQQSQLSQHASMSDPAAFRGSAERLRHASSGSAASLSQAQRQSTPGGASGGGGGAGSSSPRSQASRLSAIEGRSNNASPSSLKEINKRSNLIPSNAERNFTGDYGESGLQNATIEV